MYRHGILILLLAILVLIFFPSPLKADLGTKSEAIEKASSEAAIETEKEAQSEATPQYRQKLKEAVTIEPEQEEFPWEWDSFIRYMPSRSLKAQEGKVWIVDSESELSYTFKAGGRLPVQLSLNAQNIAINDKGLVDVSLPTHLTGLGFGIQGTFPFFFDKTYLRLKVVPSYYSGNWNTKSASFKIPSFTYLIYQPNEKWTFIGGLAAYPGEETPLLPIAGFIYKPNDRLEFNIIPSEPNISYKFNDLFSVFLEASMTGGEFRVTKDGYKGAVLQYNEMHAGGGVQLSIGKNIDFIFSSGYMFNRYLKYRDSLGKVDIKNSIYSEFRLEMRI